MLISDIDVVGSECVVGGKVVAEEEKVLDTWKAFSFLNCFRKSLHVQ